MIRLSVKYFLIIFSMSLFYPSAPVQKLPSAFHVELEPILITRPKPGLGYG